MQRLRLEPDDVEAAVDEIRALLRARDRFKTEWEISDSATPTGLRDRLLALGMRPHDEPYIVPMALVEEPSAAPPEVEVRVARSRGEYVAAQAAMQLAFGGVEPTATDRERFDRMWQGHDPTRAETYVAVRPGQTSGFPIWAMNWCGAGELRLRLRIPQSSTRRTLVVPGAGGRCDSPDHPGHLTIGPFLPP